MPNRRPPADTPAAREFSRLSGPTTDPALTTLRARLTVPARDLLVWSATVRPVKSTALLPLGGRPNPIVVGDLVICSVFDPGRIVAFDRQTGQRRWAVRLQYLGASDVYDAPDPELVYGGTGQELHALDPVSGTVRWTFSPYVRTDETIYSPPAVADGRLFIGDRRGYLHCLDAGTGEPIWRVLTSRARNCAVNSAPVVEGGVVGVATNAGLALGFDAPTGRELWRQRLDGPCGNCRAGGGRTALMWTSRSAYLFSVPDGELLRRWAVRNHQVQNACPAGALILLVTRRNYGRDRANWPVSELRAFRGGEQVYSLPYPRWTTPRLRYEPTTGMIYEAAGYGLGIFDPEAGTRSAVIRFGGEEQTDPPAVESGMLYAVTSRGRVFALRHP